MTERPTLLSQLRNTFDADHALALLKRAIATPSVTGQEAAFAALLKNELASIGAENITSNDFEPGRPNVWGGRRGRDGGDTLLLIGHTDTVQVRGSARNRSIHCPAPGGEPRVRLRPKPAAAQGSPVGPSSSCMSMRCIPGPHPFGVSRTARAPKRAKNGADLWLAAIRSACAPLLRAWASASVIIAVPSPAR